MDRKLEEKLLKEFPLFYSKWREGGEYEKNEFMCSCDDGWYDLIREYSGAYEKLILDYMEKHPEDRNPPTGVQVKQKFGALRIYLSSYPQQVFRDLEIETEEKSKTICEICGNPGKWNTSSPRIQTVCESHAHNKGERDIKEILDILDDVDPEEKSI